MSREPDWNPDILLAGYVRRAAAEVAEAAAPDPLAAEPAVYALRDELRQAQARVKHLEAALRCVAGVVKPYLGGNGTGR